MVNYDVLGRLRNLELDIEKSPDYNKGSTRKARTMIDEVLKVFQQRSHLMSAGVKSPGSIVLDKFGVGSHSGYVKDRLAIMKDITMIQQKVNYSVASPDIKRWVISKLELIKRA